MSVIFKPMFTSHVRNQEMFIVHVMNFMNKGARCLSYTTITLH